MGSSKARRSASSCNPSASRPKSRPLPARCCRPQLVEAATPAAVSADPANGSNGNGGNLLAVHFDHFQRSQGVLALPEGFVPESVTISVLEGSNVRATREVRLEF